MISLIIRYILTGLLTIGIFFETGIYTTIFASLVAVSLELHYVFFHRKIFRK